MARPPRTPPLEDRLARVYALREAPDTPEAEEQLRRALEDPSGLVVASAAKLIDDAGLRRLFPLLPAAFLRLVPGGAETDKGCKGKLALCDALLHHEQNAPEVFLAAVRVVQLEASWGPPVDTAPGLRASGALGLAMLDHADAMDELARLLADPATQARAGAAVALGNIGRTESLPLLRYKAQLGDPEPEVQSEVMSALLSLSPARSLPFVASFLDGKDADAESAALCLGESRRPDAFPILRDFARRAPPRLQRAALLALGLLRSPEATALLLETLERAAPTQAAHALAALAIQRYDEELVAQVRGVVERRRETTLMRAFVERFED